ncbi:hypothetical protein R5W24_000439 [Gemmata sp. JC717]|uniref:hypothetical protein n=1 Tax=Gemmata algarum TaxID=2975278 RepID=UPI0021BB8367|nr:hypothetical protein [Gemmata algarum]MDY3551363.1 hypothetical protein [Gemmata algarum]
MAKKQSTPQSAVPAVLVYDGIAYRQSRDQSASWVITFVCPAEELTTWSGIPQRTDQTVIGFQRPENEDRIEKAKKFFELGINQSPTAIVVGIHPPTSPDKRSIRLEFDPADEGKPIRRCKLHVSWDVSVEDNIEEIASIIREQLTSRLSQNGSVAGALPPSQVPASPQSTPDAITEGEQDEEVELPEEDEEEPEDAETEAEEESIELGRSLIEKLLEQLENKEWCEENIDALRNMARPATIIDGQHRIRGAERCEREIPFTVCAIYDCPWPEQIFQFTVVNYTAKGIPDQFITANAALSLTRGELDGLKRRLYQAGVKVVEYDLMRVVNFDSRSAFYELVNLGEKKNPSKIGYKTMVQMANVWYKGKNHALKRIISNLYPSVNGPKAKRVRMGRWMNEDWGDFFLAFWDVVHDKFSAHTSHDAGHTLWEVGHSNLMIAVVLVELQSAFLQNISQQNKRFFQLDKPEDDWAKQEFLKRIREQAGEFLESLPPAFFSCSWGTKSLNTGAGRLALRDAIGNMIGTNGTFKYQQSTLVTGKVEKAK